MQAAAERVPGLKRGALLSGVRAPALGADVTGVKGRRMWLNSGLMVDDVHGTVLGIDELTAEDAETVGAWVAPVAEAVGAELLVTDDADGFEQVADALGGAPAGVHQPRAAQHRGGGGGAAGGGGRRVAGRLRRGRGPGPGRPAPAAGAGARRHPEDEAELEALHLRYAHAPAPSPGERASLAYRLRQLTLDRWELWPRLTRYRTWQGSGGERVDGTNNGCERAIGWCVKERYRTMRATSALSQRPTSAV